MISLKGLNKADVLAALYNASHPQGMGFMAYDKEPMGREEAESLLANYTYFDYLKGRVMKVELGNDSLDPWGYDRDNGPGAAQRAIDAMLAGDDAEIHTTHEAAKQAAAEFVRSHLHDSTTSKVEGGVGYITLGLSDVADALGPAIDRAIE